MSVGFIFWQTKTFDKRTEPEALVVASLIDYKFLGVKASLFSTWRPQQVPHGRSQIKHRSQIRALCFRGRLFQTRCCMCVFFLLFLQGTCCVCAFYFVAVSILRDYGLVPFPFSDTVLRCVCFFSFFPLRLKMQQTYLR